VAASPALTSSQSFQSAADLVAVTVTVRDGEGRLVTGLTRDVFEVYEDGGPQPVTQFTNERVAVSFAIVLDISESMFGSRIEEARSAIEAFVASLLHEEDEFSIVAFNHQQAVLAPWTADRGAAADVLRPVRPAGSTAIYDAILATLPLFETRRRPRAAIVVISDGADTASDGTLRDVRSALVRSEAFAYAIAIDPVNPRPLNTGVNVPALREITDQSGGRTLVVRTTGEMLAALSEIAEELDRQYLIGYHAPGGADGEFHSIRVRIPGGDYRVRARTGYVATPRRQSPARDLARP
jgi:Ca-activated chloride channel family protein